MVGMERLDDESTMPDNLISPWRVPTAAPVLAKGTVHLWRIPLDRRPEPTEREFALLSEDERARADRFHFPRDRRRFVVAHAALRLILGLYTGKSPESLRFEVGRYGKPTLAGGPGPCFNLTHSGELAVVGLAPDRELGVDVEQLRDMADLQSMAARFFTPAEQTALLRFLPAVRGRAFLDGWTRKEAVMKALGLGVAQPPESIEVSLEPGNATLHRLNGLLTPDWAMTAFVPGQDYIGAVAMQGPRPELSFWDWSDEFFGGTT
jgi:4'-phosphopantetheinyl transferase